MKRFKKMQWKELLSIMAYSRNPNGHVVDGQSADVIHRIKINLNQLAVMGDDEQRTLWLPFRTRSKYCPSINTIPEKGMVWWKVSISTYKEIDYLWISDLQWNYVLLKTKDNGCGDAETYFSQQLYNSLVALEQYMARIVKWVIDRPNEYNEYIAANLPYSKRHGKIQRAVLHQLLPDYRDIENRQKYIDILTEWQSKQPTLFPTMSLNTYASIWRPCFDTYEAHSRYKIESTSDADEPLSDVEMFINYSPQGWNAKDIDPDSEQQFIQWKKEYSPYHNLDIAYARIHLSPIYNEQRKGWEMHLSFSVYGYYIDMLNIIQMLHQRGIYVSVYPIDTLLHILKEDDLVGIVPFPDKYMNRDGTTNQIYLPDAEEYSEDIVAQIIAHTQWTPEVQVRPNN